MAARCVILVVKLYQLTLSRILPDSCIFTPSCSEYAVQALSKYGLFKGVALAGWRILRCNPFNKNGGYDPVP